MYRVTVTTTTADAFGFRTGREHTFPAVESVPTYAEVAGMLIAERIRERIVAIDVRHIFKGRTVARFSPEHSEIVEVF